MNIHYGPQGYEAVYHAEKSLCVVNVRGCEMPDGTLVERKGIAHPNDKVISTFVLPQAVSVPMFEVPPPARETFEDVLLNRKDLLGELMLRNDPKDIGSDYTLRAYCACAYKAGLKIREKMNVLNVNKLVFSLAPSLFAFICCLARSESGEFWILDCATASTEDATMKFSLVAYIMEAGQYIPPNAIVRCGIWDIGGETPRFQEIPNDRIAARNFIIQQQLTPPF